MPGCDSGLDPESAFDILECKGRGGDLSGGAKQLNMF